MFSPFFFPSSNPHRSAPGSCPLLLFCFFFFFLFFLTLSGLVSCVTGNVTVSSFFLCKPLLLLLLLLFLPPPSLFTHCISLSFTVIFFFLLFHYLPTYCYSASLMPLSSLCLSLHCCTLSVLYHISPEELFSPPLFCGQILYRKDITLKHVHTCVHAVLLVLPVLPGYLLASFSTVVFIKLEWINSESIRNTV